MKAGGLKLIKKMVQGNKVIYIESVITAPEGAQKLNIMKRVKSLKGITVATICAVILCFYSCGPSAEDILKKYEQYPKVDNSQNGLGIHLKKDDNGVGYVPVFGLKKVSFEGIINEPEVTDNMDKILLDRFIVLDAENPTRTLDVVFRTRFSLGTVMKREYEIIQDDLRDEDSRRKEINLLPRFILVGFKGIRKSESEKFATPAMFVIFEVDKKNFEFKVLTSTPLLAENLFPTDFPDAQFVRAIPIKRETSTISSTNNGLLYKGNANFPQTNSFEVSFVLAADKSEISDVTIAMTGMSVTGQYQSSVITVNGASSTTSYYQKFKVQNNKVDASFGNGRLKINFDKNGNASGNIAYTYIISGTGSNRPDIPVNFGSSPISFRKQ